MKPSTYIELIKEKLDDMMDEHPYIVQKCTIAYSKLVDAIDDFESDINRSEFVNENS